MEEQGQEKNKKTVGLELASTVVAGPAVFANNAVTTTFGSGVRLTFTETNPELEGAAFRSAVYMEFATMLALYDLIGDIINSSPELKSVWEGAQKERNG